MICRGVSNTDLTCNQRCINLEIASKLQPRTRNYFTFNAMNGSQIFVIGGPWPIYVLGYCGSNMTDPNSELGVVRHVGLYAYPSSFSFSLCGNYMLNTGKNGCCISTFIPKNPSYQPVILCGGR